jgi:XapX domain-containing protein
MTDYLVSLVVGLGVGALYALLHALLHVRSPAPPLIALVGLLGMVLGERAIALLR